ncbi:MAG: hypothetical protein AB9835_08195 [Eubacteriales bacterium]
MIKIKGMRILSVFILLCFAMVFLSCGSENAVSNTDIQGSNSIENSTNSEASTENPLTKDDLQAKDFGGREFVILVNPDPSFRHFYDICVEDINGELINDAVYQRNLEVEERFNVKIKDRQDSGINGTIKKSIQSGAVDYQAAWVIITEHGKLAQENMFMDLYKVPQINLNKTYWDKNVVNDFTVSGKLYGIMGDISTSVSVFTHLLGVNKTMAAENGINVDDIYQSVRDGTWTLDKLYTIIRDLYKDIDGDGTRNYADAYGLGVSPAISNAAFSASGEKWVVKDKDGEYKLAVPTARIDAVYSKIAEIVGDKNATITTWNIGKVGGEKRSSDYEYVYYDKFMNNTVLFADIDVGIVMDYRKLMDYDFGVVPLPKFEESQPNYSVYAYPFYPMLTIPSSYASDAESIEFIGTVIEGMASSSYKILTPAFYDTAFKTKFTRDEASIEMLDIVLRSRIYDMMNISNFGSIDSSITAQVQKNSVNLQSLYDKNQVKAETDIQKLMDAYAANN